MMPVSDPHFMIASITTHAAAVDYANHKLNPTMWVLFMYQPHLKVDFLVEKAGHRTPSKPRMNSRQRRIE